MVKTQERVDVGIERPLTRKRFGIVPMVLSFLIGCLVGWGLDEANDTGKDHILPGGGPTDGVSGPSPSDRVGR
jgi:hypothetical protein